MLNMVVRARVLTPGLEDGPSMVNVLPDPVCPYAKMHTLYLKGKDKVEVKAKGQKKIRAGGGSVLTSKTKIRASKTAVFHRQGLRFQACSTFPCVIEWISTPRKRKTYPVLAVYCLTRLVRW